MLRVATMSCLQSVLKTFNMNMHQDRGGRVVRGSQGASEVHLAGEGKNVSENRSTFRSQGKGQAGPLYLLPHSGMFITNTLHPRRHENQARMMATSSAIVLTRRGTGHWSMEVGQVRLIDRDPFDRRQPFAARTRSGH